MVPLVPVIVTANVPVVVAVQDRVEVPDVTVLLRVTLVGVDEHVIPVAGETVSDNATVPAKPLRPVAVIVEVPGEPCATDKVVGLAVTEKSVAAGPTVIVTVALVLTRVPDVA